jgi:hypothetical protein
LPSTTKQEYGNSHGTEHPSKFYLSFSSPYLVSKLNNVGVRMGSNKSEIDVSTRIFRNMELDRLTVIPKALIVLETTYLDEEEANVTTDGQLLSHLVGEVSKVGLDDDELYSLYELKASGQKSKSSSKKQRKLSKFSKSPIVSK